MRIRAAARRRLENLGSRLESTVISGMSTHRPIIRHLTSIAGGLIAMRIVIRKAGNQSSGVVRL